MAASAPSVDANDGSADAYFTQFQEMFDNDAIKVARRLDWEGLAPAEFRARLGKISWDSAAPLPVWTEFFYDAIAAIAEQPNPERYPFLSIDQPLAFEDIFAPFIDYARVRLESNFKHEPPFEKISTAARISFERELLTRLSRAFFSALNLEFTLFNVSTQGNYHDFV